MKVKAHSVTRRIVDWRRIDSKTWQSGNVRVVLVKVKYSGDYAFESWGVQLRRNRRWQRVCCPSRPWFYGSAGQAKRGVTKWTEAIPFPRSRTK